MLTTRLAWLALRLGWNMGVFDSLYHWTVRLVVRLLQFGLCLAALILLSTGFVTGTFQGQHSSMLGSRYVLVTSLLTFFGLLYAFWWVVFIELLHVSARPRVLYMAGLDLVLSLSLLAAAVVLLLSDFVRNCLSFGHFVRCTNLNIAVVLMFLAAGSFLLTPWLGHRWARQAREDQERAETPRDTYRPAATPTTTSSSAHQDRDPETRV
jgi:hypothetical protein